MAASFAWATLAVVMYCVNVLILNAVWKGKVPPWKNRKSKR